MTSTLTNTVKAATLVALGLAIAAMGVYVAEVDDAPGAGGIGLLLMLAAVILAVRTVRNRLSTTAWWAALAAGLVAAALAASLTRAVAAAAPLFAQPPDVPSVGGQAPSPGWTAAIERARPLVGEAIATENLPGVSIAVGVDGTVVWAEGFGWRDVGTETPVTPETRFNIGSAASVVTADAAASVGLANTGAEPVTAWSPEHIGEPEEDFPPLAMIRHHILQPLGLAPAEYPLPANRATFYVPRFDNHDPRRGRRLMYMRDLACCADGTAFYSTPSDLVRFAMATSHGLAGRIDGTLAGGNVMSLLTRPGSGIVVAVASNVAYADTAGLAVRVADVFAELR